MTVQPYSNLHAHTTFSTKDGHAIVDEYVKRAAALGHPAVGVTDHGTMAAAPMFLRACETHGIKPIIGCEVYTTPNHPISFKKAEFRQSHHLTLLAQNEVGYRNLVALSSAAHTEGFYHVPRVDRELMNKYAEGIICLSGCVASELSAYIIEGDQDKVDDALDFYQTVFKDRFYLELQNHGPLLANQLTVNKALVQIARRHGIPCVGTNDSHFCEFHDAPAQRALLNVKGNGMFKSSPYTYVRSNEEMALAFPDRALFHTLAIAEQVERYPLGDTVPKLPISPLEKSGKSPGETLLTLVRDGLQQRLNCSWSDIPFDYEDRLDEEIGVIRHMGAKLGVPFERYLLTIADIARFCREERIRFGPRGSAAGSLVCWALGISEPDPIKEKLLFERFLNPYRVELPDVDMDFQDDKRDLVLQYLVDTYGTTSVARIGTYAAIGARSAIKDAARTLQFEFNSNYKDIGDAMSKKIPFDARPGGMPLDEVLELEGGELRTFVETSEEGKKIVNIAKMINGRFRGTGTHAAGVVIGDRPLATVVPLMKVAKAETEVIKQQTQYEMGELESLGLLKFDILGLQTLSMMDEAVRMIEQQTGQPLNLWELPVDDEKVWDIFQTGDTLGLFQLGGRGMTRAIMSVRPENIQELAMVIAVFRPGPIENLPKIAERKKKPEMMESVHPTLDDLLEETYGIPVYQEQIMKMMQIVAGFSLGEADIVRKAMGKKKRDLMASFKVKFDEGGLSRGYTPEDIESIWNFIVPFADYGFNRAHAVCYAYLAYQSAWLKVHHPVAFYSAAMTIEARAGSKANETAQERIGSLVLEAKRRHLTVLPPSVEHPCVDCSAEGPNTIRYGLASIKGVGRQDAIAITAASEQQPFTSLADLMLRVPKTNVAVLKTLVKVGAMPFGTRPALMAAIDNMQIIRNKRNAAPRKNESHDEHQSRIRLTQKELFAQEAEKGLLPLPESSLVERLMWELQAMGIVSTPIPEMKGLNTDCKIGELIERVIPGETPQVRFIGVMATVRPFFSRNHRHMAFGTIVDGEGSCRLMIWPRTWDSLTFELKPGQLVLITGNVSLEHDDPGPKPKTGEEGTPGWAPDLLPVVDPEALPVLSVQVGVNSLVLLEPPTIVHPKITHQVVARTIQIPDTYDYNEAMMVASQLTQLAADNPGSEAVLLSYRQAEVYLEFNTTGLYAMSQDFPDLTGRTDTQDSLASSYTGPLAQRVRDLGARRAS